MVDVGMRGNSEMTRAATAHGTELSAGGWAGQAGQTAALQGGCLRCQTNHACGASATHRCFPSKPGSPCVAPPACGLVLKVRVPAPINRKPSAMLQAVQGGTSQVKRQYKYVGQCSDRLGTASSKSGTPQQLHSKLQCLHPPASPPAYVPSHPTTAPNPHPPDGAVAAIVEAAGWRRSSAGLGGVCEGGRGQPLAQACACQGGAGRVSGTGL